MKQERIICAAIWYQEYEPYLHNKEFIPYHPKNIDQGIVLCGHRHGSIIQTFLALTKLRTASTCKDCSGAHVQGFLTTHNRFVDRKEARDIFIECGGKPEFNELYSEDLY